MKTDTRKCKDCESKEHEYRNAQGTYHINNQYFTQSNDLQRELPLESSIRSFWVKVISGHFENAMSFSAIV